VHTQTGKEKVAAIALQNDQLFVTREGVAQVSIYNSTSFKLQIQLSSPELGNNLRGLAACDVNKYLYISDDSNTCVHRFRFTIGDANNMMHWKVGSSPYGLSVNSARNVLVTCASNKVKEYTPSGSLVREISDNNSLWHAVELSSGMLAVSRWGPIHGIGTVSMDGHVIHSYGNNSGSVVGQMNEPRGLAIDKHGYILVADANNHRILVMNPPLTEARQLPLPVNPALQFPCVVSMDESRGILCVGEGHGAMMRLLIFHNVTNVRALFNSPYVGVVAGSDPVGCTTEVGTNGGGQTPKIVVVGSDRQFTSGSYPQEGAGSTRSSKNFTKVRHHSPLVFSTTAISYYR